MSLISIRIWSPTRPDGRWVFSLVGWRAIGQVYPCRLIARASGFVSGIRSFPVRLRVGQLQQHHRCSLRYLPITIIIIIIHAVNLSSNRLLDTVFLSLPHSSPPSSQPRYFIVDRSLIPPSVPVTRVPLYRRYAVK